MPSYVYQAVDSAGRRSRGRISASTAAAVAQQLEKRGLLALDVSEAADGPGSGNGVGRGRRQGVLEFTRAVAALLPAGMPLARALGAAALASPASMRPAIESIRDRVERGDELAAALAAQPRLFSPLYVGIIRAGEKSGSLDEAFQRLARHLERQEELRANLISMSIYPALLAFVGGLSVLLLVFFVLPRFAEMIQASGGGLPQTTAAIVGASVAAREYWPVLAAVLAFSLGVLIWLRKAPTGRELAAKLMLRVPLVGRWRRMALAANFARMLGELLSGGSPVLAAISDARDCTADSVARDEMDRIRAQVREGRPLHEAISESLIFPPVLAQLVALGEESGRLADFLVKAAELLERQTSRAMERLVALAQPAVIVFFGGIVFFVALALLQALYGTDLGGGR